MRRLSRILLVSLAALAVLAGGGALFLFSSLPQIEGRLVLAGPSAEIRIDRDGHGIPRIVASSERDAAFALGFLHAQDRLFQMEMLRRAGAGRLAEILGVQALRVDRTMRTFGFYGLAERQYARLSPDLREVLDSYAAGVNAFIGGRKGALPLEYYLLRFRPEPWRPADTLVFAKLMALQLSGNYRGELMRARLAERLSPDEIATLYPEYPKDGTVALASLVDFYRDLPLGALYAALPDEVGPRRASNNWVVEGARTESGKPILANDPHLGFAAPGNWYLARIELPGHMREGVTAPGVPFVVIGRNERIAWGFTTTGGDVEDLFIERPDPSDPSRYLVPDGSVPFAMRTETIRVRDGDDVVLRVRSTRHGPVVSDVLPGARPDGPVLALAATFLAEDDMTPQAAWDMTRAADWDGFNAALRNFHAPQQNMVYADTGGSIGFVAPARIPIRAAGDGWLPVPGWTGDHDWTGFVPFEELPRAFDPAAGRIVTANNKIVPDTYKWFISRDWDLPNRARRITNLIDGGPKQTASASAAIQADTVSLMARDLLPLMLTVAPRGDRAKAAIQRLKDWDARMDRDKIEPLLFTAWLRELNRAVLADELGELFDDYWDLRPLVMKTILTREQGWCDDKRTAAVETCADMLSLSLDAALADLARRYGDDPAEWRWGRAHPAAFGNAIFGRIPVLRDLFGLAIPSDGGYDTVNRGATAIRDPEAPFASVHGSGLRMVLDMATPDEGRWMIVPGQSGNPLSPHWGDLMRPWRDFEWLGLRGAATLSRGLAPAP